MSSVIVWGPGERVGWDVDAEEGEESGKVSFSQALPSAQPWEESLLRSRGADVGSARGLDDLAVTGEHDHARKLRDCRYWNALAIGVVTTTSQRPSI
jgi:hypothetical protein